MPRSTLPRPTDAELEILRVLWDRGPSTVRQVQQALGRPAGYTTVLKLMQIMTEKQLLLRDQTRRTHIYRAAASPERTQRQLVNDLARRAFGGSARALIMQALATTKATPREMRQIQALLDQTKGGPS